MNRQEYSKKYYEEHKHKIILTARLWELLNPEKHKEDNKKRCKRWYMNHPEIKQKRNDKRNEFNKWLDEDYINIKGIEFE